MFQNNGGGSAPRVSPQDLAVMLQAYAAKQQKPRISFSPQESENIREARRGTPKYPVVAKGLLNGVQDKNSAMRKGAINLAFGQSRPAPGMNPKILALIQMLMQRGAMAGDGRLERPAPQNQTGFTMNGQFGGAGGGGLGGY